MGLEYDDERSAMAALRPDPTRRLHNFSFPDLISCWGSTRQLRCCKIPFEDPSGSGEPLPYSPWPEKLRFPPSGNVDLMAAAVGVAGDEGEENVFSLETASVIPWNLRARRAACNVSVEIGRFRLGPPVSQSPYTSPQKHEKVTASQRSMRLLRLEGGGNGGDRREEKVEKRKVSVALLREEIEEDFHVLKGTKPPRRPKKRPRIVQKKLDSLFPGLWLSDVTLDLYEVSE